MPSPFSYSEYEQIIHHLQATSTILDYSKVNQDTNEFCVIRHDVEFSVERAHDLAIFEKHQLNLTSSYLFQLRNNCYNICSDINIGKMHDILALGHSVGLHLHFGLLEDESQLIDYILQEVELFQKLTGIKTDRFSYHRPTASALKPYHQIEGLINCYSDIYFHYFESCPENLSVKYYTDSRHIWQHGHPLTNTDKKIQLLTHPYSWTQEGLNNFDNFSELLQEKHRLMKQSINNEISTFPVQLLR